MIIMLSKGELNKILTYKDGLLFWKININSKTKAGTQAGFIRNGYPFIRIRKKAQGIHRVIWVMNYGKIPKGYIIDHIDRNKLNNNITNLRLATKAQNAYNSKLYSKNTSGYRGVAFMKHAKKWRAKISANKKYIHLGYFDSAELANEAYIKASIELHGAFSTFLK